MSDTDKPERPRVGRLDSIGRVATELARLYRAARKGDLESSEASRLASVLGILKTCLEASSIEHRLDALEARHGDQSKPVSRFRVVK